MATRNKLTIDFKGFDEMFEYLDRVGASTKNITEDALKESFDTVTPGIKKAMAQHHRTGRTEQSIVETADVKWAGTLASVDVGFDLDNGGLPSIFLMYGTPKMSPDRNLYNAIYGSATKRKVRAVQEKVFTEEIRKVNR